MEVMPEVEADVDAKIASDDLKVDVFRSSGPGGQHMQKTSSAVRLTHIPTGLIATCQSERSQHQNKEMALRILQSRLLELELAKKAEEKAKLDFEEKVIQEVVNLAQVEFPPILVEAEIHQMLNQRFQGGNQELEEYLSSINKTEEELHEELHPLATKRVIRSLVLGKVVEEEKIEVSDSEIDTEVGNLTESTAENKVEMQKILSTPQARESIGQTLIARKTVRRLVEIAKAAAGEGSISGDNEETKI